MAEARSAVILESKVDLASYEEVPKTSWSSLFLLFRHSVIRRLNSTRTSIKNGMWPTSWYTLGITTCLVFVLLIENWEWANLLTSKIWYLEQVLRLHLGLPYYLRILVLSMAFGFVFFFILMHVRRYILRLLLSYNGWLFELPKSQGLLTKIWSLTVRCVSGYHPSLYSYQSSLPKLHVPAMRETLCCLIDSLKPLYGAESKTLQSFKEQSKHFEKTLGAKVQRMLVIKSWLAQNYVSDWWEKYVYLMGRSSLPINSNYYILDHSYWHATKNQFARAATVTTLIMEFNRLLTTEQLEPLVIRNTIPLCMAQYERLFNTTRIPGVEIDEIQHIGGEHGQYIIVYCKGVFYKLHMKDRNGYALKRETLQSQLESVWLDADLHKPEDGSDLVASLTGWDRISWAKARKKYFATGINKSSLNTIERAAFFICMEDESHVTLTERSITGLCGNGCNLWFDKSLCLLFSQNGRVACNVEHSFADAPVAGHLVEYVYTEELLRKDYYYTENGDAKNPDNTETTPARLIHKPSRLLWDISPDLRDDLQTAYSHNLMNAKDIHLVVHDYTVYGKGFIKTCKMSPDAFVQVAFQLAFYRLQGHFALTYESCMARLFLGGRTETVRSLTQEVVDFVLAMIVPTVDQGLKIRLLRRACDKHQLLYKLGMAGKGIDRHLFSMYVSVKALGEESEFLKNVLQLPWTLSTSQQPQQQFSSTPSCDVPEFRNATCPGGGFGPVSDHGYGISYMLAGDYRFYFHVSSKRSTPEVDSEKYVEHIIQALADMKALFDRPVVD